MKTRIRQIFPLSSLFASADADGKAKNARNIKNKENTFYFTFKNFGQNAISLTFVMVNSGTTAETDAQTINLAPGEVTSITLKAAYKNGSDNHNLMAYFTATADNVNMQLGVALSAVLG